MKTSRFHGPRDIRIEEADDPACPSGHAVVRVRAAGICGGDLHEFRAARQIYPTPYPRPAQGHEFSGEVASVAADVTAVAVGDRVGVQPMISCGLCAACRGGQFALCPDLEHLGVRRPGGFAEYCVVPVDNLHVIPKHVSFDEAALLDCVAVAVHAVHRAPIPPASHVVVIGVGAIGLALVQVARASGAARVTAVGTRPGPLAVAKRLGADEGFVAAAGTPAATAAVVYETAGGPAMLAHAVPWAAPGGTVAVVGEAFGDVSLDAPLAMTRELTLAFVWSHCARGPQTDFERALELVAQGRVQLAPTITHRFPLTALIDGYRAAEERQSTGAIKVMIEP